MLLLRDVPSLTRIGAHLLFAKTPYFPVVASFDVTNRCTLRCKHCYWWLQEHQNELEEEVFYKKVKEIKARHPTIVTAIWMGGEPLLRKELVEKCKSLFTFNEVITNGTVPLPRWRDVRFACSVDGTKKYHEAQRGKNTYERIRKNINCPDLNVNIICVVTKLNEECLEDFIEEWKSTHIRTIGFGFYTPIKGKSNNNEIWLNLEERDRVLDRIIKLKQKYPRFVNSSVKLLNNFRSGNCQIVTERCRRDYAPFNSMCFTSMLSRKFPCVIGENAECDKCGCGGSVIGEAIRQGEVFYYGTSQNPALFFKKRALEF